MIVALVGLPGSGKSTVGRQLARRLSLPYADADHAIEQRLGCSIRDFFEREGEDAFRDVEEQVLDELTQRPSLVLSTGGGAVLRPANREHLHARTQVVYLHATPEDLHRRLRHDQHRPLLGDPLAQLRHPGGDRQTLRPAGRPGLLGRPARRRPTGADRQQHHGGAAVRRGLGRRRSWRQRPLRRVLQPWPCPTARHKTGPR
jgi:shikimate kinase